MGHGGDFKAALPKCWLDGATILEAKAFAMGLGLNFAANLGVRSMEVESDSSRLVSMLNSDSLPLSYVGFLREDICSLSRDLDVISFSFQSKKCNSVAHRLAQFNLSLDLESRWTNSVPSIIKNVILEYIH